MGRTECQNCHEYERPTERELRVKRHVAYSYLLNECLKYDEQTGLYPCPSRVWKLVVMHEMEKVFDFDLRGVPGFFYDLRRTAETGGWMVNTPERGFIKPTLDARARVRQILVLKNPKDSRPRVLSSKGLCLGT